PKLRALPNLSRRRETRRAGAVGGQRLRPLPFASFGQQATEDGAGVARRKNLTVVVRARRLPMKIGTSKFVSVLRGGFVAGLIVALVVAASLALIVQRAGDGAGDGVADTNLRHNNDKEPVVSRPRWLPMASCATGCHHRDGELGEAGSEF